MSVQEVLEAVKELSPEEREQVKKLLDHSSLEDYPKPTEQPLSALTCIGRDLI